MKALIRREGETVLQSHGLSFINWNTGAPLTNSEWSGGPYILVNDYIPDDPADDFAEDPEPAAAAAGTQDPYAPVPVGDTIVIDGVTYTRTS